MASIAEVTSGTQSATLDTEHTLGTTQTDDEAYVCRANLTNMAAGDRTVLRVYVKVVSAGSLALWREAVFSGAQSEKVWDSEVVGSVHGLEFRLEQTDGTGRAYEWSILKVV